MSRIDDLFVRLRDEGRTGLVTYTTAGDPTLDRSAEILLALDRAGADLLEVGVPFSDPVADGPVIERAVERARAAGGSLRTTIEMIARTRSRLAAPVVLFTYANPVLRLGLDRFAEAAADAGVDGALILDLPLEEAGQAASVLAATGLDMIFLLSPTTTDERIAEAARLGRGFLYAISRLGVTGTRETVSAEASRLVDRIRARTKLPIAVGFGVSRPEHVREIGQWADAAVVGSALVSVIADAGASSHLLQRLEDYVRWLKGQAAGSAAL